jgi:cobyrinic acid a,c-diamide synthase
MAGISGDSGKTLVSLGLAAYARKGGTPVAAFKKGPDFIDAAWLSWASGRPARHLDTYLMGVPGAIAAFQRHALSGGLNLVEGNRGLYDGLDAAGTHSTAVLAKSLLAPLILVLNVTKMTRTAAALVLGCQRLDPDLRIAGVILNRVAGKRHEGILRDAIQGTCGIPVLGALPKLAGESLLPGRHLGLFTPEEHPQMEGLRESLAELCARYLDMDALLEIANSAPPLAPPPPLPRRRPGGECLVGVVWDSAFTFYYPDNLEALERLGATLVPISPLSGEPFPANLDGLYAGGGFPETHGARLAENRPWMDALASAARDGLPIYAECGGLMALCRAIVWEGERFPMAGVLPFDVEVLSAPQGHGYTELLVDRDNPFFPEGTRLRGHEFHYSRIIADPAIQPGVQPNTACQVERGTGCFPKRDAIIQHRVWASYTHLHALASPQWAPALVRLARRHHREMSGRREMGGRREKRGRQTDRDRSPEPPTVAPGRSS